VIQASRACEMNDNMMRKALCARMVNARQTASKCNLSGGKQLDTSVALLLHSSHSQPG